MKSREEIQKELKQIIDKNQIEGLSLDILLEHSTDSIYLNQVLNIQQIIESIFCRSSYVNSRITHAMNLMYSVPRGKFQRIRLDKIRTTAANKVISKFELIADCGDFLLVAETNDEINNEESTKYIDCLVVPSLPKEITYTPENQTYIIDLLDANISNDYILSINNQIQQVTTDYPTYLDEELKQNSNVLFDVTNTDFSLRIIKPVNNFDYTIREPFTPLDTLKLTYFEYQRMDNLEPSDDVKSKIIDSIVGDWNTENMEILGLDGGTEHYRPFEERMEDKDSIFINATNKFIAGQNMIRSVSDVSSLFLAKFSNIVNMIKSTKVANTYYYVTNNKYKIKEQDIEDYLSLLRKSYFISDVAVLPSSEKQLNDKQFGLIITVNQYFNRTDFINVLSEFQYKLGETITVYDIMMKISPVNGVVKVGFKNDETYITEVVLEESETLNLNKIQYEIIVQNQIQFN